MDDIIANFCAITSADPAKAQSYLEVCDNDFERAIELYFETGGVDLSGPAPANPPPPPPTHQAQQGTGPSAADYIEINDDDEIAASHPVQDIDEDEALALRLMQEEVDQSGPGNDGGVRSPIPQRDDILVDPSTDYFNSSSASYGYGGGYGRRGRGAGSRGVFNQATPSIWNAEDPSASLADATGGSSEISDKANRLAQMYRRPFEIMNRATLEEARDIVRSEEPMKWIMVNIMDSREFACQILNRDLWSDRTVQQTIRENFYFLQYTQDEPDGQRYRNTYPFDQHPHIGIIDPRTGEQVKTWEKVMQPSEFVFELHEFLERYSLDDTAINPLGRKNKIKKDFDMMTEEEQMEAALAASLGRDISESPPPSHPQTPQLSVPAGPASAPSPATAPAPPPREPIPAGPSTSIEKSVSSVFASIQPSDIPEPPQSPQTTRIQFRFPEGGRPLVRRFNKTDTIRDVFAFVKGLRSSDEEFELVFVGRRLLAEAEEQGAQSLDRSIVDAGLANGSLTVEV